MNAIDQLRPQHHIAHTHVAHKAAPAQTSGGAAASSDSSQLSGASPYGNSYEGVVTVKPEVWSKIRGLNEPGAARNDHLAGILHNLGFSESEIYGKAPNGQKLLDWIAKTNGLRHPDLIHPSDSLVLPSHLKPQQLEAQLQQAGQKTNDPALQKEIESLKQQVQSPQKETEGNGSSAAVLDRPVLTNTRLIQNPQIKAGGDGIATSQVNANTIADSDITQRPNVTAGRNGNAAAGVTAATIVNTPVAQQPTVKADQDGQATAQVQANTVVDSPIQQAPTVEAGANAAAQAQVQADTVVKSPVTQASQANGQNAVATAEVEANTVTQSPIEQGPRATAEQNGLAASDVKATTLDQSPVNQAPVASSDERAGAAASIQAQTVTQSPITQAPVAAAGVDADAAAQVKADTVDQTAVQQTATATAPAAQASADAHIGQTTGPVTVAQNATAANGKATTSVAIGQNQGDLGISSQANGANTDQRVAVGTNNGNLDVNLEATPTQNGVQDVALGTTSTPMKIQETLNGNQAQTGKQTVSAQNPTDPNPYWDRPRDRFAPGQAELNVSGVESSKQSVTGMQSTIIRSDNNGKDANLSSDSPDARYEVSTSPKVNIEHKGHSGLVEVDAQGTQSVNFSDEGAGPTHQGSRNRLDLTMAAPEVRIGATTAEKLVAHTRGTDGDDHHEIMLPTRDANPTVISDLGAGNDKLTLAGNSNGATTLVTKTEGSLDVNLNLPNARGNTETILDLGKARLTGELDTGATAANNTVRIHTDGAAHHAAITGAGNPSDLLVIDADASGKLPKVVYREASSGFLGWGSHSEEAVSPDGWKAENGVIHASGFSRILLRQGDKIVGSYGDVGNVESFEAARARVEATQLPLG